MAKRQKDLINKGVQGDLNTYIKSLSEVQSAVEFFAQVRFHFNFYGGLVENSDTPWMPKWL